MIKKILWIPGALIMLAILAASWMSGTSTHVNKISYVAAVSKKSMVVTTQDQFAQFTGDIYNAAQLQASGLDQSVFQKALTGYYNLKLAHKLSGDSHIITVVDFSKSSRTKRMWIVDLLNKKLLLNTWVAHGQGSGDEFATHFSDNDESHQSSLGFYVTDDIYWGKHGRSLKLVGLDKGFNSNAYARSVVLHAADYVSEATINTLGRLGRSFGCPAVSPLVITQVINTVKGKNMLYINGPDSRYSSKYLDTNTAATLALASNTNSANDTSKAVDNAL